MCNKIARWELVELLVAAGAGTKVSFLDQPELRTQEGQDIFVKGIEIFPLDTYANSQVNQAVPGVPDAELKKAVLVLYVMNEERIHYIPLLKFVQMQNATVPFNANPALLDDLQRVDWPKSYVQFSTVPAGGPYVIPFGITYLKISK